MSQLKDTIKEWILNHPNVIDYPDGKDVIKIGKMGSPKKCYVNTKL